MTKVKTFPVTLEMAEIALAEAIGGISGERHVLNAIHDLLGTEIARRRGSKAAIRVMYVTATAIRDEMIALGARR